VPSFRVIVSVGRLRPGVAAPSVEPAASEAAAGLTVVEATGVDAVAGEARLTVRFLAEGIEEALRIAEHTVGAVQQRAEVGRWQLTERVGGRWFRRA
jgi:hypothetical protein